MSYRYIRYVEILAKLTQMIVYTGYRGRYLIEGYQIVGSTKKLEVESTLASLKMAVGMAGAMEQKYVHDWYVVMFADNYSCCHFLELQLRLIQSEKEKREKHSV